MIFIPFTLKAKQNISVDILTNISRSKGNQTFKFGQIIEHEEHFS